jgi:hypothetical protein
MITNGPVTIFNKYIDTNGDEQFLGTIIPGSVFWGPRGTNITKAGLIAANTFSILIPSGFMQKYLEFIAWQALDLAHKALNWTLQEGDWMVQGAAADVISPSFTLTQLKAKYSEVGQVISYNVMTQGNLNMRYCRVWLK